MKWLAVLLFLAAPFWETKAPAEWTEEELLRLFTNSPWAQIVAAPGKGDARGLLAYLATASPMAQAEHERELRYRRKKPNEPEDPLAEEYRVWFEDNRSSQIVLAISIEKNLAFADAQETARMQDECVMRIGRKKYKMTGYFPPSPGDRYLRLAFPREVQPSDKSVAFDLYLPGVPLPYRTLEFSVKDLMLKGKLEM